MYKLLHFLVVVLIVAYASIASAQIKLQSLGGKSNEELQAAYSGYFSLKADRGTRQKLRMVDILTAMKAFEFEKPENNELLEMTEDQIEEISYLKQHYARLIKEVYGELPGYLELNFYKMTTSEELAALDRETQNTLDELKTCVELDIMNVLMEVQIKQLAFVHLRMGLPKVLVESPIGQFIELSEDQKDRIADKATKLSEEIDKMLKRINEKVSN